MGNDIPERRGFRTVADGQDCIAWQRFEDGNGERVYQLDLRSCRLADYQQRCEFLQFSPDSYISRGPICPHVYLVGRVSISGTRFVITRNG